MPSSLKFENPIRDEIFNPERLEQHAITLASELKVVTTKKRGRSLLPRLEENYQCLLGAYKKLTEYALRGLQISPAGEWFIDNFHIIEDQVREVREDLPESYYRELPKIIEGELADYPQVYAIALSLVSHQDSHIDVETTMKFLHQYQNIRPLLIGEIWAIAIALRLVLIENLRRIANQVIHFQEIQEWADDCADQILSAAKISKVKIREIRAELIKELEKSETSDYFIILQLSKRLRDQTSEIRPISDCLDQHLASRNLSFEQLLHAEYQRQAASQVTVSNIVGSMRLLSNIDWPEFFENVNKVDPILEKDPASAYKFMDFKSRDQYRHVIERLQKKTGIGEIEIAKTVLELAQEAFLLNPEGPQVNHVGYYLIDRGLKDLEKKIKYRGTLKEIFKRKILNAPNLFYFSTLSFITLIVLVPLFFFSNSLDVSFWTLALILFTAVIPITDSCIKFLNLIVTRIVSPKILPKIDLDKKIPDVPHAFIIIPTILADKDSAARVLDGIEVRYLSNQEENLSFALLSDFLDSNSETTADDDELLDFLSNGIDELNKKYDTSRRKFFLFHRKRLWNSSENKWMGWERKRGKIHEFNRFLRGASDTSFIISPPFEDFFSRVRYVLTLDSDTQLPRGSAKKLIGTILHPLNSPHFDKQVGRVTQGFGILQPRISITPESAERSWFAKIFSGLTGIDPYTTAVSDVYQDLFGEGIYTGKGLYDVDCFEKSLQGRVPENALLSHDLFEGVFVRTALVTEIELLDDYPSQYESFSKRQHRWTRGDWQLLPWLFSMVFHSSGLKVKNNLPFISKWKIFDNLRRSLVTPMVLLWIILSWTLFPGPIGAWSAIILIVLAFPFYIHSASNLFLHPKGMLWINNVRSVWVDIKMSTAQFLLSIICIPHQAYLQIDAIIRTLYRVFFSKKNLLNWQSAAVVESGIQKRGGFSPLFFIVPILASFAFSIFLFHFYSASILYAIPFLLSWSLFPVVIKNISRDRSNKSPALQSLEIQQLRNISRKTWNFFETFVTEQDNWLPPDNFQEDPKPVIAHRTSPTNLGLLLLSTCSASNFGYINTTEMLDRLRKTLATMLKLERCFGHFYNWYDTQTLQPLDPRYISTVDSGNLAGHLIAVKQSAISILDAPIISQECLKGIADTIQIVQEKIDGLDARLHVSSNIEKSILLNQIKKSLKSCELGDESSLVDYQLLLGNTKGSLEGLRKTVTSLVQSHGEDQYQAVRIWIDRSLRLVESHIHQVDGLLPKLDNPVINEMSLLLQKTDSNLFSKWQRLIGSLGSVKSLNEHKKLCEVLVVLVTDIEGLELPKEILLKVRVEITKTRDFCSQLILSAEAIYDSCHLLMTEMDFKALFNTQRKLFSIGYNVEHGVLDDSYYDLLASESRLASFVAIAKGDIPQSHWFHLGRQMTSAYRQRVLISWSASMFEYLMPLIVMRNYPNTLLNETQASVVKQQISYGKMQEIPWGVSESAYNARDLQMNYQYGPFGIPGIGLKRGLSHDIVISPYSTALAALVSTHDVLNNFNRLKTANLLTDFGFYESVDYTKGRLQTGQHQAIVRNFMVHHQGMILTAIDNILNGNVLQHRFHNDLMVRSSEILLQEKTPKRVILSHPRPEETQIAKSEIFDKHPNLRHVSLVNTSFPKTQVLSNGKYTVMLTASGSGFSKCGKTFLSRWSEDPIKEQGGSYLFIEDTSSEKYWSASFSPMNDNPGSYKTSFSEHKVEFWCRKNEISSHTEIIVSPEDDVEMRRITLINHSRLERNLNITSYLEPILTTHQADLAHRAFSNLFIETEYIPSRSALLARRRKRSAEDDELWAIHLVTFGPSNLRPVQYETSRNNFIGRTHDSSDPIALKKGTSLTGTVGAVIDPILSLRKEVSLEPHATVRLCFVSGLADSRQEALRLIDCYHDQSIFDREDEMGWTQNQAELRHLNISFNDAMSFQKLGSSLLFPCGPLRSKMAGQKTCAKNQSALWAYGISGDNPILFVVIKNENEISLVRQLIHAHEYLRYKGINYDLVILNSEASSYRLELQDELLHQVRMAGQQALLNIDSGIFILKKDDLPLDDLLLFETIARVYISSGSVTLKEIVSRRKLGIDNSEEILDTKKSSKSKWKPIPLDLPHRQFKNGLGGFSEDGKEYIISLNFSDSTPAPWCNVIANSKDFGFLVSEQGSTYTWSKNSRENRITPWSNDVVSDPSGETFYLVDLDSREKWSPSPGPIKGPDPYLISHGQGYTHFQNNNYEIRQKLSMFCSIDKELKISQLLLKNESSRRRRFCLYYYIELVLGSQRARTAHHIVTELGKIQNTLTARNPYHDDFGDRITYVSTNEAISSFTCDRTNFFGPDGNSKDPFALDNNILDNQIGYGLDPCLAFQLVIELEPLEEKEINFVLGQSSSEGEIHSIIKDIFQKDAIKNELKKVTEYWDKILDVVRVKTPFPEFDILINRWLLYQNLSCRIWGRSAFYQSGGAFGFRDQLQDVTALLHSAPELAREHILTAAACQFKEGDVLHWWHPPSNKGVRTHFSDDRLWLPYAVATYVKATGDFALIDEVVPFVDGPELPADQEDLYFQPQVSEISSTIYDHCVRAINRSLELGSHGLPLMGGGDWNDGMNRVGLGGKGESVWMAWFLMTTMRSFIEICDYKKDSESSILFRDHEKKLTQAVETEGWDGKWYRRAFFDDGTPLGSSENDECKIDSLTQSWAAISGVARQDHLKEAMASLSEFLVKDEDQMVLLFTPPFDKSNLDPGYIKGYLPGLRENGGQYTHAAIWAAMGFAAIDDGNQAFKLLSFLNPINHSRTHEDALKYGVEPYVISADIYSNPDSLGRGGWSWYTGSSGWYYRALTESLFGLHREGNTLRINPCLPDILTEYQVSYKFGQSVYEIKVEYYPKEKDYVSNTTIDGENVSSPIIDLIDDGQVHHVSIRL